MLEAYEELKDIYAKHFKPSPKIRYVDFNQGVDARLFNEDNVAQLARIAIKPLRIAFDDIINSYNKKIEDLKKYQQKEILQYEEKFNELKVKYNPNLDKENIKLKSLLSSISELISPVYEKFSKKKLSSFDNKLNENIGEDKEIIQINFLICFIEQLFTDNKHLIETIQSMEIEKNDILNIPYITNTIKKNDILKNIQDIMKL